MRWSLLICLAFALGARWCLIPVRVVGASMLPTYVEGRFLLASPIPPWFRSPPRGEVLVVGKRNSGYVYLKRVIGLPGETVEMRAGVLWVEGQPMPEPYAIPAGAWQWPEITLGPDEFLVAGDDREIPPSLHTWGRIDKSAIRGTLLWQGGQGGPNAR